MKTRIASRIKTRSVFWGALALLGGLVSLDASPQVVCSLGSKPGAGAAAYQPASDQRPTPDAMQLVARANAAAKPICQSHCPSVAVLRNSTAASAMLIADGSQVKLVYAPQFFAIVADAYGDPGIVAIIAHEFGHALDDVLGAAWIQKGWSPELRADSWAGCTLAKSGFTGSETQAALGALAKYPSPAHPAWTIRLPAIRAGYAACGGDAARFSKQN